MPYTYAKDANRFIEHYHKNSYVQKLKTYIHSKIVYNALTAPRYSSVGEHCAHGENETLDLNMPKNSLFPFDRNALERNRKQNSHSYKDVHVAPIDSLVGELLVRNTTKGRLK